jgi:hypothetical protein
MEHRLSEKLPSRRNGSDRRRVFDAVFAAILVVAGLVFAFLLLPPFIRFFVFLLSGDVWRAVVGAGFIALCLGIALVFLVGRFEPRRSKGLLRLAWTLILACPACLLLALVGSGWLADIVRAIRDFVPWFRHLLAAAIARPG